MQNDLTFMPCYSLQPNQCVAFTRVFKKNVGTTTAPNYEHVAVKRIKRNVALDSTNVIKKSFHNFRISQGAYRTLKKRINWLYYLAKAKPITTYNGKKIYNFKIGFLTLTLPSKQIHCTAEITKNCLNQFLTEIRQRTKMENYVWRLEFQNNGNVHYHIVTDTYIDYFFALKLWNRILSKYGYVQPYTAKFSNLNLSDYNNLVNASKKIDFSVIAKRYASGCKNSWKQPPTIDVKSVISQQKIANYIAKYFGKDFKGISNCNSLDNEANSSALRLWFCSRSLSKVNCITNFCEAVDYNLFEIVKSAKKFRSFFAKYATVYYFEISTLGKSSRILVEKLLRNYAFSTGYKPVLVQNSS